MQRRKFVNTLAASGATLASAPVLAQTPAQIRWRLASSYPKSLDTVYGSAEMLADRVSKLTDGQFQIRVFAAGEIAPALQALDAVQGGSVECCHTNSYY